MTLNEAKYVKPPVLKRAKKGKCYFDEGRHVCFGAKCLRIKKNCLYSQMKRYGAANIDEALYNLRKEGKYCLSLT